MPYRIQIIVNLFEFIFLNLFNVVFILFISFGSILAAIPLILSTLYTIVRIKRDVNTFHNGSLKDYIKFVLKKNK